MGTHPQPTQPLAEEGTNGIALIPRVEAALELLDLIPLAGKLVMGDAMFCQRDLSRRIRAKQGNYLWPVKDNQPDLLAAVADAFDDAGVSPPAAAAGRGRAPDRTDGGQGARAV